jgi:transcriptional regulator with XRE-family HTH domain
VVDFGRRPKPDAPRRAAEVTTEAEFAVAVGDGIRRARQQLGLTQVELAERADLSPNYVARLERGELGPSLWVAFRLAEALGVEVESLTAKVTRRTGKRRIQP